MYIYIFFGIVALPLNWQCRERQEIWGERELQLCAAYISLSKVASKLYTLKDSEFSRLNSSKQTWLQPLNPWPRHTVALDAWRMCSTFSDPVVWIFNPAGFKILTFTSASYPPLACLSNAVMCKETLQCFFAHYRHQTSVGGTWESVAQVVYRIACVLVRVHVCPHTNSDPLIKTLLHCTTIVKNPTRYLVSRAVLPPSGQKSFTFKKLLQQLILGTCGKWNHQCPHTGKTMNWMWFSHWELCSFRS